MASVVLTARLPADLAAFVDQAAASSSRSRVLEEAVREYRKRHLAESIRAGLAARADEYAANAADFAAAQSASVAR